MAVFRGTGSQLLRGDGASPEVFAVVGDIVNMGGPEISKDEIDVTALDSTSKESIGALKNNGALSLTVNWNPQDPTHVLLRSDAEGAASGNFRIIWSDVSSTQVDFPGEVMEFSIDTEAQDAVKASVTLKIIDDLVWS